jgi:hypothetical protein
MVDRAEKSIRVACAVILLAFMSFSLWTVKVMIAEDSKSHIVGEFDKVISNVSDRLRQEDWQGALNACQTYSNNNVEYFSCRPSRISHSIYMGDREVPFSEIEVSYFQKGNILDVKGVLVAHQTMEVEVRPTVRRDPVLFDEK